MTQSSLLSLPILAAAALWQPALAQEAQPPQPAPPETTTEGTGQDAPSPPTTEAEDRGLTGSEVQDDAPAPPTEQGTLQPEVLDAEETPELYALLQRLRAAPPGLGENPPTPRPNALASEPTTEMEPLQPEDPSLFPEGYVE